ncbi:MAG TPA: VOC family protein, partial [Planctomycetaceae bacterium]
MTFRIASAALFFAAVAALAQDGQAPQSAPGYSSPRVDFGIVVSDIDASKAFYEKALGLKETREFTVPGEFAATVGLTKGLPFTVHVMQIGDGPDATQVKLMEFQGTRPHRPDNSFIHSSYGVRYLTF